MKIKIFLEENVVILNYSIEDKEIKEKLDYCAIEKLIDYVMENDVRDVSVDENETCSQYVDLIKTLISKISEKDFKECYQEIKNINEQSETDSSVQDPDEEIPF